MIDIYWYDVMKTDCYIRILLILCVLAPGFLCLSCDDNKPTYSDDIISLKRPGNPDPPNQAVEQALVVILNWSGSGMDNVGVWYSLYFGTAMSPPLLADSLTATYYRVDFLAVETVYYWRVIARDSSGASRKSPLWKFSTIDGFVTEDFVFPLSLGNSWEYSEELRWFNVKPVNLTLPDPNPMSFSDRVEITALDTLLDSTEVFVFHKIKEGMGNRYEGDEFFNNQKDGFYYYGYGSTEWGLMVPPKISTSRAFSWNNQHFSSISELLAMITGQVPLASVALELIGYGYPPRKSIGYPLEVGSKWAFRGPDELISIDKKIVDFQTVDVPAGEFECFVIEWILHPGFPVTTNWIDYYDYLSKEGLIKRSITVRGVTIYSEYGAGTADLTQEYVLTGYSLNAAK